VKAEAKRFTLKKSQFQKKEKKILHSLLLKKKKPIMGKFDE